MDTAMMSHVKIITPYFNTIESIFGPLADEARRHAVPADVVAKDFLSDIGRRQRFAGQVQVICDYIVKFWQNHDPLLRDYLWKIPGLKAGFAGEIGPQVSDRIFERCGLYFDTIVVPDPLLHVAMLSSDVTGRKDYYLIKYGIIQCQLREFYLAESTPPVAYLLGDLGMLAGPSASGLRPFELANLDSVMLVNELFGTSFDSFDKVIEYFERFATNEEAVRNMVRPELFILESNVEPNPEAQWAAYLEHMAEDFVPGTMALEGKGASPVGYTLFGRMGTVVDLLIRTAEQGFHPLVAAPVSYHWLTQKIRINQKHVGEGLGIDFKNLAVTNALLSKEKNWLGNLTLGQLVSLRKRNELADLRAELTRNFELLSQASFNNLDSLMVQVDQNLKSALVRHQEQLKSLDRRLLERLVISVPTLLVSIATALQPTIGAIVPSWISGLLGVTSVKDLVTGFVNHARERKVLARSPIGILWSAKNNPGAESSP